MKILTVIGARPQFIKAAALNRYIKENSKGMNEVIIHTGQHYDKNMSDIFFQEMDIAKPDYNINVGSSTHGIQTGIMLQRVEEILIKEKPDLTLVYGDTNSTLAGALAASKLHIPVAHIEAGLRSFNMYMPEEQNRILTDNISQFLFCPTDTAVNNLKNEGIYNGKKIKYFNQSEIVVKNIGDIMYDAVLYYKTKKSNVEELLLSLNMEPQQYILSTIHRAENTDDYEKLSNIFNAFAKIPEKIVLCLHPRTRKYLYKYNLKISSNVNIIEPVGYIDMIKLEKNAKLIITDSGGIQKEAYFLRVPCITLRDETEWIETMNDGWNYLAGSCEKRIIRFYNNICNDDFPNKKSSNYFGDGTTSGKIVDTIVNYM